MALQVFDTYSFLLETPDRRHLAFEAADIAYMSSDFSRAVYEQSRGQTFSSHEEAYRDWVETGRAEGLPYQTGKNTYLKIILKVKDEPELLRKWIDYHARIVGYHNIIIMDCGSTDPVHLDIIEQYRRRILILNYPRYYDQLHSTEVNAEFYRMIAKTCKYVTVLDADEFLFCYDKGVISTNQIVSTLKNGAEDIYAGTWFFNTAMPEDEAGMPDFTRPISFSLDRDEIVAGTAAGKAIMRAALHGKVRHIGHNLQVREVVSHLRPTSFGVFGVFHLRNLNPRTMRARLLKHLRAKKLVPPDIATADVEHHLSTRLLRDDLKANERVYIRQYLGMERIAVAERASFTTALLAGGAPEISAEFSQAMARFDFAGLLSQQRARFGL